jgi:radical SAM protein with 4Fe4S-binding SPASM domain
MIKTDSARVFEKPWIINLELSNACNLECVFCDHPLLKKEMAIKEMEDSLLLKALSDVKEYLNNEKIYELGLVGLGEPTLDKDFERHIKLINSHAYMFERISFNSNLVSLKRKHVEILLDSKINAYTFSINASNKTTYMEMMRRDRFEQVIENFKRFISLREQKKDKPRIDVQVFESKKNSLNELKDRFRNCELENINFFMRKVYSKPVIRKDTSLLSVHSPNTSGRYPCWDIYTRIYIDVVGNLYSCTIGNDSYREASNLFLGNIKEASLFKLFNSKKNQEARERSERGELAYPECGICNVWSLTPNNFIWNKEKNRWIKKRKQVRSYCLKE